MLTQKALTKIHRVLGWSMLVLLPAHLATGLMASGRAGGGDTVPAALLHMGAWLVLPLGAMIVTHGLLGIRFAVMRRLGNRPGAALLILLWAAYMALLAIHTV